MSSGPPSLRARALVFLIWTGRLGLGALLAQAYTLAVLIPFLVMVLIDRLLNLPGEAFAVALGLAVALVLFARLHAVPVLLGFADATGLRRPDRLAVVGGITITGFLISMAVVLYMTWSQTR